MIYFLIPVYNESPNLPLLVNNLISSLSSEKKFFVFVDDGSTDNSSDIITKEFHGSDYVILGDGKNHGPGYSFNLGFEWILDHTKDSSDKVITMEADNTSDFGILETMVSVSKMGYDLVLASVYVQGGGFEKTSFLRRILSSVANLFFRFIFDVKVLTLSSFYRVYNIILLKKIKEKYISIIDEKGFICMLEILLKAIRCNAGILEIPMTLRSTQRKGKSKMKILKTFFSYIRFLVKPVKKNLKEV